MSDIVRPVGAFKHVHVESLRHCPHPPAHTLVAVGPSIHPAQSGGALRANGLCPPRRGTQGKRVVSAPKRWGSGRTGCVRQSGGDSRDPPPTRTHPSISSRRRRRPGPRHSRGGRPLRNSPCGRQRGGDAWHSSGEPPNLDSRLRGNDGCAKVSGGGNPSPGTIARTTRSPRVAPMPQRRVSRGARRGFRADAGDTQALVSPAEAGIHHRRRSTRSPRVHFIPRTRSSAQSVHPESCRCYRDPYRGGARRGLRADAGDARALVIPAEAGIHPRRRSTRSSGVHFIPRTRSSAQCVHPE